MMCRQAHDVFSRRGRGRSPAPVKRGKGLGERGKPPAGVGREGRRGRRLGAGGRGWGTPPIPKNGPTAYCGREKPPKGAVNALP